MKMSEFNLRNRIVRHRKSVTEELRKSYDAETEPLASELLENISSTPIGRLLEMIAFLPEIRQEKVSSARVQIDDEQYDLGGNLDTAIDRVLEEMIVEGTPTKP